MPKVWPKIGPKGKDQVKFLREAKKTTYSHRLSPEHKFYIKSPNIVHRGQDLVYFDQKMGQHWSKRPKLSRIA